MGSTQTLQGLPEAVPAGTAADPYGVTRALAEATELAGKTVDPPTACFQAYSDVEHYDAVLAAAGVLMAKGLNVSMEYQKGRHAVTGEVQTFISLEAHE